MNNNYDGQILFALICALVLASVAGVLIARRYNTKILSFMQLGESPNDDAEQDSLVSGQSHSLASSVSFDLNRQNKIATWRYRSVIIFIGILLSSIITFYNLENAVLDQPFSLRRTLQLILAYAWPIIPGIGIMERWSSIKILVLSLVYTMVVAILIALLNIGEPITLPEIMIWLFGQQIPLLVIIIILTCAKLRTLGPYLLIIFFLLVSASLIGFQVLDNSLADDNHQSWIVNLAMLTHPYFVFILFGILPWLITFYPIRTLARKVARLYDDKSFSDYLYLLIGVWFIVILFQSLILSHGLSISAYTLILSILVIPLVFRFAQSSLKPKHLPPTLLLLRVFREDDGIKKLFDNVLERWRYTGNTVMIGGKDLAIRTLEPNELFNFLNGKLQGRFIRDNTHLQQEVAQLDFDFDPDGRFRINEFLCYDTTWKLALDGLISKTNLVLMDLRDYHADRKGCSYELDAIANSPHLQKIIMLINSKTDIDTAKRLLGVKENETIWIQDNQVKDKILENKLLKALLE